ncbi:tRNA-dihydrouridine synthase family protein [Candidatus Woesearchaeota archaeon]|nr:tRNA-dihydrouridine synthase family protein [Candidatus Woesearchaeota archaeon]
MKIGNIKLKHGLILAPMAEVTDLPYRMICKKYGAELCFTEMLNSKAIFMNNDKTLELMKITEEERPVGIQICGNDTKIFEKITDKLKKYDVVDLNCGCPVPKIVNNKQGAWLLDYPEKIKEILEVLIGNLKIPVTAKIRLGKKKINVLAVAKKIEDAGASAITIHARTAEVRYKVKADLSWIKKVKKEISIPVIGNGDVFTVESAKKMLEICDGVMVARGALGDPLIFKRITAFLEKKTSEKNENNEEIENSFEEKINAFFEYVELCEKYEMNDFKKIRRIGLYFIQGFEGARKLRDSFSKCKNVEEMGKILNFE